MVPTRESWGGSIFRGGDLASTGSAAIAAGGGRREGEKIGRSRVTENRLSGTAHNGLALGGRAGEPGGATTPTAVTGSAGVEDTAGGLLGRASSPRSASSASLDTAAADATSWTDNARKVRPIVKPRLIWHLAIAPTPSAGFATSR